MCADSGDPNLEDEKEWNITLKLSSSFSKELDEAWGK